MQDEQVEQSDEAVEPTAEDTTTETEGAADDDTATDDAATEDADTAATADAVDQQAAASDGTAAEQEPEVPDDSSEKIKTAQEHINKLDMDQERNAAEQAQKQL